MSSAGGGCHRLGGGEPLSVCPSSSVFVFLMVRIHPSIGRPMACLSLPPCPPLFYHPVPPSPLPLKRRPPAPPPLRVLACLALPPSRPPPSLTRSPSVWLPSKCPLPPPIHSGGPPLIKILPPPHACSSPSSSSSCPLPLSRTTPGERQAGRQAASPPSSLSAGPRCCRARSLITQHRRRRPRAAPLTITRTRRSSDATPTAATSRTRMHARCPSLTRRGRS